MKPDCRAQSRPSDYKVKFAISSPECGIQIRPTKPNYGGQSRPPGNKVKVKKVKFAIFSTGSAPQMRPTSPDSEPQSRDPFVKR